MEYTNMRFRKCEEMEKRLRSTLKPANKPEEKMSHYASEQLSCIRSRYYSWMGIEPPAETVDDDFIRRHYTFGLGNATEKLLGELLSAAGMLPSPDRAQVRVRSRKYLISGSIDFLANIDGTDVPIECKSCKDEAFRSWNGNYCTNCGEKLRKNASLCKGCNLPNPATEFRVTKEGFDTKPSLDHYAQLQTYINLHGYEYGYLFYLNKNTSECVWFEVMPDPVIWDMILEQNKTLSQFVDTKVVPERPYNAVFDLNGDMKASSDWQCRFCRYASICFKSEIDALVQKRIEQVNELFSEVKQ